ncbi:MAG: PAS domain-containing protein, partial [Gammaproteobacteria bacterium]|nr:PAS domain-containing protein [Gammaproteobacteria bacterium]
MTTSRVRDWRKSIIFKVNLAIAGVFLAVIAALAMQSYVEERGKNLDLAISQLQGMNAFYFDSLNTLMLADAMEEREELRLKMLELPGITEVRVNRAPAVVNKFGEGLPSQQSADDLDHRALAGESVVEIGEHDGHRLVTVVEPYRLTENTRGTDCLECHRRIEPGTVAGTIRLSYSLEQVDSLIAGSLVKKFGLFAVLALVAIGALSVLMHRMVRVPIAQALGFANAVADGQLDNNITPRSGDEMGQLIEALCAMQSNLRKSIEKDREVAAESLRIKLALDSSSNATTVSDADNRLIYLNPAARELFEQMEAEWRSVASGFAVDGLIGQRLSELLPPGELREIYRQQLTSPTRLDGEIAGRSMRLQTGPVYDDQGEYQGRATQWEDRTELLAQEAREQQRLVEERRVAAENQRIKVALDQVSANVMLADPERRIIYANRASREMLRVVEKDFRSEWPSFDAERVVGNGFEAALGGADGVASRHFPQSLDGRHEGEFELGGRTMHLVANPVTADDGTRLGTALEWTDRTQEVAVEREIDQLVESARDGDLDRRIALGDKNGFFRQLGEGFNRLLDELSNVFDDIAEVMGHMADGDLRHSIDKAYKGRFGQVKTDINRTLGNIESTVARLHRIAGQVNDAAGEISLGNENLSARTEQQASSIQQTAASMQEFTTTVRNNADNAQAANQASASARQAAEQGGQVVTDAVAAMDQINGASAKIAEIIGVIDEIAFQT